MTPPAFLALLKRAGLPPGLGINDTDAWAGQLLGVDGRTVRRWRLSGRIPHMAVLALKGVALVRAKATKPS